VGKLYNGANLVQYYFTENCQTGAKLLC